MKTKRTIWTTTLLLAVLAICGAALADDESDARLAEAREALNKARYKEAAELYEVYREQATEQERVAEALYWEAFARYRLERTQELKKALQLLEMQAQLEATENLSAESEALAARIAGELAERGETDALREIYERSEREQQRDETRVAALHALMRMDPDKARPILEKIVRGETKASPEMRHNAVFILCREDERGADIVLDILPEVEDPELVQAMVICLAHSGSTRSFDVLADLLRRTDDPEVAQIVLMSLGEHGDDRAFDILADIALDPQKDPELRAHALLGLARTGDERTAGIAAEIIRTPDQDPEVLEMAMMALVESGGSDAADVLLDMARDPSLGDEFRAQALFMAGHHGHVEAATLKEIYEATDSRDLKLQICHVLTRLDDGDQGFETLLEIVKNEDDPEIRRGAVFWMGQFDDPRAAEFLLEIINEE